PPPPLPSFPTRRSSDLPSEQADGQVTVPAAAPQRLPIFDSLESDWFRRSGTTMTGPQRALSSAAQPPASQAGWTSPADEGWRARSEEHTSELQSQSNLV